VIVWLLRCLAHGSFRPFVLYRVVALGLAVIVLAQAGVLDALP